MPGPSGHHEPRVSARDGGASDSRARAKEIKAGPRGTRTRWALVRENHGTARQSAFQDEGSADC